MEPEDFQAEKRMSYFPNAFSFTNPDIKAKESIQSKYIGQAVYPLKTIRTKQADLLRYTPLQIKDVQPEKQERQLHSYWQMFWEQHTE